MDWRRHKKYGYEDIGKLLHTFSGASQVKQFVHQFLSKPVFTPLYVL